MIRIGVVGTSWWSDSMYLPALADHPQGRVVALCGRDQANARALADKWSVAGVYADWQTMIDKASLDAVVVASTNDTHYPITMAALDAGLAVLCEKPIAGSAVEANAMAARAAEVGAVTMTPFTYRYMPIFADVHRRVESGFVGTPYHLNIRYFAGYARDGRYSWRFDTAYPAAGVVGDLGSHLFDLAEWLLGPIESVGAVTQAFVPRDRRIDGRPYVAAEDSAIISVRFANGAMGSLQPCAVSWEGSPLFGQTHHLDLHGGAGTVYAFSDWDTRQEVVAIGADALLANADRRIADESWRGVRRDNNVHDTYRDIFRSTNAMTRGWVDAIVAGEHIEPSLAAGARVQTLMEAAMESAAGDGRQIPVPS